MSSLSYDTYIDRQVTCDLSPPSLECTQVLVAFRQKDAVEYTGCSTGVGLHDTDISMVCGDCARLLHEKGHEPWRRWRGVDSEVNGWTVRYLEAVERRINGASLVVESEDGLR